MKTEMGEYVVGAYLKIIKGCDFVDYNVRFPGGGLKGLNELDVVGFDFENKIAYLCEVTTHIRGLLIVDNRNTVETIRKKYKTQKAYSKKYLDKLFPNTQFMFWSPNVPEGYLTRELEKVKGEGLEVIINKDYSKYIKELRERAKEMTEYVENPFFRALQILEHLKK